MSPCKHRLGISGAWPCALGEGHDGAHVSSNGTCALSSYVEPSNYNAHYIDTADVRYGAVPVYLLRQAQKERDEARAALAGAEASLTAEREHSARLSRECQERHDELRAEVEKLGKALTLETRLSLSTQRKLDEARAEVERLERLFQQTHGVHHSWVDARHKVAEKQREACARFVESLDECDVEAPAYAATVRDTPLVTEGDK